MRAALYRSFGRTTGQMLGISPTGTSIRTGASIFNALRSTERRSSGLLARIPTTPNSSASLAKSGLCSVEAIVRPWNVCC